MVVPSSYESEGAAAAKSVLVEILHLLGEYRDYVVVVGGWVPPLLLPETAEDYAGTLDVDLALDHAALKEEGQQSIGGLLTERGYTQSGTQPFIFYREVVVGARTVAVEVDLLASEHGGTTGAHRTQTIQDVRARKARGCNLVFGSAEQVVISASLPSGGKQSVVAQVAGMVPFLTIKGLAVKERRKDKDAYDVYFCVRHRPGTFAQLAEAFRPWLSDDLVQEALSNLEEHFATPSSPGPTRVADFEGVVEREERELLQRDVSEQVRGFLAAVRALGPRPATLSGE